MRGGVRTVVVCVLRSSWTTSVSDQLYSLRTCGAGIDSFGLYMTTNANRTYIQDQSRSAQPASQPEVREQQRLTWNTVNINMFYTRVSLTETKLRSTETTAVKLSLFEVTILHLRTSPRAPVVSYRQGRILQLWDWETA